MTVSEFMLSLQYLISIALPWAWRENRLWTGFLLMAFYKTPHFFSIVVAGMYLPYWWLRMNECNVCLEKREKFFLSYMYGHGHPVRDSFKICQLFRLIGRISQSLFGVFLVALNICTNSVNCASLNSPWFSINQSDFLLQISKIFRKYIYLA